jgi:hypothetical protein
MAYPNSWLVNDEGLAPDGLSKKGNPRRCSNGPAKWRTFLSLKANLIDPKAASSCAASELFAAGSVKVEGTLVPRMEFRVEYPANETPRNTSGKRKHETAHTAIPNTHQV